MALWVIAAMLTPGFLNQLDKVAGKIMILMDAIKRKRRGW